MFGLLQYLNSYNLGDEIQSIAAKQYLPRIDALIDRDSGKISDDNIGALHTIYNGWFDGHWAKFPLGPHIRPLFVSFHINESDDTKGVSYNYLQKYAIPFVPIASNKVFWQKYEPIGCRDVHTHKLFEANGINSYVSACLTLTLQNDAPEEEYTDEILIVDVQPSQMHRIPDEIKSRAKYVTHLIKQQYSQSVKLEMAEALLNRYKRARLVITSRLHALLPRLAYGRPVFFLHDNLFTDVRFRGLIHFADTLSTDPMAIQSRPSPLLSSVRANLRSKVEKWVQDVVQKTHGVSIITACMDRQLHLQTVLPTWLAIKPKEIVIVNWGSSTCPSVDSVVSKCVLTYNATNEEKTEVVIVNVTNVKKWVLTTAFNFAAKFATCKNLLKLDCDSMLHREFLYRHNVMENIFFAGNWKLARDVNERHTNGIVFVKKSDFFSVGGYNEMITLYGFDDDDLYLRLSEKCVRLALNLDYISHLEHDPNLRKKNQSFGCGLDVQIECNRLIAKQTIWPVAFSKFTHCTNNNYELMSSMTLNDELFKKCFLQAIHNRCQSKKIFLEPQNGMGNRLRVIASAYNIAKASNRKLIVIWLNDKHCEASFEELFNMSEEPLSDILFLNAKPNIDTKKSRICIRSENIDSFECYRDHEEIILYNYNIIKDEYVDDTVPQNIYIKSACVLKSLHTSYVKESTFLKDMKPTSDVQAEINCFLALHDDFKNVISVHIRSGQPDTAHDDTTQYNEKIKIALQKWREASHWTVFAVEIKRIMAISPNARFFVCCDTEEARESLFSHFDHRCNLFSFPEKLYDRSKRQIQLALIDAVLMSKSQLLLASNWSSFSEYAHRLGYPYQKIKYAGKDF